MSDDLRTVVEREILGWPGVSKQEMAGGTAQGFVIPPATVYNLGRRHLGHIHDGGIADLSFPRAICGELIAADRAEPHGAGLPGTVSYFLRTPADIPGAVALFRLSYDRARTAAHRAPRPTG